MVGISIGNGGAKKYRDSTKQSTLLLGCWVLASSYVSRRGGGGFLLPAHGRLTSKKLSPSYYFLQPSHTSSSSSSTSTHASTSSSTPSSSCSSNNKWIPQDLIKDNPDFLPIPANDYIQKYQSNPDQLWPVEFFVIAYRHHHHNVVNGGTETELLVRKSANGTSKYGVGTGVPVTRWTMHSSFSQQSTSLTPPRGYNIAASAGD